ncbi:MAG: cytochrome P450 [Deltaproteobacteria bacterium]
MPPRRPPGPVDDGASLLTSIRFYRDMTRDSLGTMRRRFERYGDLYFNVSRGDPLFVTRHPDHAYQVLVSGAKAFGKRSDLEPFLGQGLLEANGAVWRRQRRLMQPSFSAQRIAAYRDMMIEETEKRITTWSDGETRDIDGDMMALTLAIVSRALFSHEADDAETVSKVMTVFQEAATGLDLFPSWLPTPLHRRQAAALKAMDDLVYGVIDGRDIDQDHEDLLQDLLRASDAEGGMSRKQVRDELVTMFLAGHETTSLALMWTFYLLAQHPEIEARVHEEVAAAESFDRLPFTANVLKESMRLYPPAYVVPRVAVEDTELGGYTLERGAEVVVWIYFCHHDERWFTEPERFDPDRFAEGSDRVKHPHAYLPFGAGSRTCIGRHFASFEAQLLLATIVKRFSLSLAPDAKVAMNPRITLGAKHGMKMVVRDRG